MDIFDEIKEVLYMTDVKWVSDNSGVSTACLYLWLNGTTQLPRLDTVSRVASCLGFNVKLVKKQMLKQVA